MSTKKNYELNKEYWAYYLEFTNAGNSIKNYCGVFKIIPLEKKPVSSSYPDRFYYTWDVEGQSKFPYPMNHNITNRLDNDGIVFETKEEAIAAHDKKILETAVKLPTAYRERCIKKMFNKVVPVPSTIESESIAWYDNLSEKEKGYIKWLKDYYSKI